MKTRIIKTKTKPQKKSYKNHFLISLFITAIPVAFLFFSDRNNEPAPTVYINNNKITASATPAKIATLAPENKNGDIDPQKPLSDPPAEIKALYSTSWSAASPKKMDEFISLIKKSDLNAMVIDIKDYSGYIAYDIDLAEVARYKAKEIKITKINSLIKKLHDQKIYTIARIAVFQDPVLARARTDLAVKNSATGKLWLDRKGLAWIDPAASEAWDYNIKIAKDALSRGFDEVNFDYIRFPSDGNLGSISYPFYNSKKISKSDALKEFFSYLRKNLKNAKISADLFGLATVNKDDLGIGQIIENAYANFDYISPMVYPSHYAVGFLGYKNPAEYPYEVVKYSMEKAAKRLEEFNTAQANDPEKKITNVAKLRPWLQAFDMGAKYGLNSVNLQIKASDESGGVGWMLWSPSNNYSGRVEINK